MNRIFGTIGIVVLFGLAPVAHATDLPDIPGSFYPDQRIDFYPDQTVDFYSDQYTDFYADSYSYDYGYMDYGYDYGYAPGMYASAGAGSVGFVSSVPSRQFVSNPAPSVSNTCTAVNSCNDNSVFNAPTVVTINDNDTVREDRRRDRRDDDRRVAYRPVYPQPAPYVTLSQVPYTGLPMTPTQMVLYWGFIILWCLVAAYLIAIKKVHKGLATRIKRFLFGDDTVVSHPVYALATPGTSAVVESKVSHDNTDSFILAQINRTR